MSNVKISELPPFTGALSGSEQLPIAANGTTQKLTSANLFKVVGNLPAFGSPLNPAQFRIPLYNISDGQPYSATISEFAIAQGAVPAGGSAGEVLTKNSNADYDIAWKSSPPDGDKGDIIVSGSGSVWTIDSSVISAYGRTLTGVLNAASARSVLGLTIGTNVQAWSANLDAWSLLAPASKADSSITLTAGSGLTGGGDLSTSRTFNVGGSASIIVGADDIQRAALTGDVTAAQNSNATTIANSVVSNAKLADMAQATVKGRAAGAGTGAPSDLSGTQVTAILDVFTPSAKGLVPASGGGTTNFLRADGNWAAPPGGGGGSIGGSTGPDDNRILRSDGTGGATLQASSVIIDDSGNILPAVDGTQILGSATAQFGGLYIAANGGIAFNVGGCSIAEFFGTNQILYDAASHLFLGNAVFNNNNLKILDTDSSNLLGIKPGSNLTADRILTITTGDADRTLDISAGNVTVSSFGASLVDDADAATARTTLGTVAKAGDTFTGLVAVQAGNSTSNTEFLKLQPTDFATGKPYITIKKDATANKWIILLWDGTSSAGIINFGASILALNDVPLYPNIPINVQSANYTLTANDAQQAILHPSSDTTARTFTIPANASVPFPVGTAVTFINQNGAGAITIGITSDVLRLAGSGATGSRTLAANGIATAIKLTSTEWIISGNGLT